MPACLLCGSPKGFIRSSEIGGRNRQKKAFCRKCRIYLAGFPAAEATMIIRRTKPTW